MKKTQAFPSIYIHRQYDQSESRLVERRDLGYKWEGLTDQAAPLC